MHMFECVTYYKIESKANDPYGGEELLPQT